jgi:hypothetical protein
MKVTAIEVTSSSVEKYSPYCLSWDYKGDHYHVWLNREDHSVQPGVGTNGRNLYKRASGSRDVRYLDHATIKNVMMIAQAHSEAQAAKLFELCDLRLSEAEKKRLAQAHAAYLIELQQQAGPEMFKVLQMALVIVPMLKPETCVEADRANLIRAILDVVKLAENGDGKVAL